MFFVKEKFYRGCVSVEITDENVYTICPGCGREYNVDLSVDLADAIQDGGLYLGGTEIYCEECSKKRIERTQRG